MSKTKRAVAALLLSALLLGQSAGAAQVDNIHSFTDYSVDQGGGIIEGHWAEKSGDIQLLLDHEGITGLSDGNGGYRFEPDRSVTTAELLSILLTASGNPADPRKWPFHVMNNSHILGLIPLSMAIEGNQPITREKMAMVLVKAASILKGEDTGDAAYDASRIPDLEEAGSAYQPYIQTAYGLGLLVGTGDGFRPKDHTTRAEVCAIVNRLFEYSERVDNTSAPVQAASDPSASASTTTANSGSGAADSSSTSGSRSGTRSSTSGSSSISASGVSPVRPATPAAPAAPAAPGAASSSSSRSNRSGSGASQRPFFPVRDCILR